MSTLIQCRDIAKSYGPQPLFTHLDLAVHEGDRLGIVGANGSGKSTLLRLLAGLEEVDDGEITRRRSLKLTYVGQAEDFDSEGTVLDALAHGSHKHTTDPSLARLLSRTGFADPHQSIAQLSGGWKKRLAIIIGLATEPDVLLLDEPTNHLDIESIEWLENLLQSQRSTVVLVSHDRVFLDRTCKKIAELNHLYPTGVLVSDGGYTRFLEKRENYRQEQTSYAESLANKMRRETEWLRQGVKARTTKAQYRIDAAGALSEELQQVKSRLKTTATDIDFSSSGRKSKVLIDVKHIAKRLGDRLLLKDLSFTLSPHTRIGLLGQNGSGKTTLLKLLMNELKPDHGTIQPAVHLKCVYFDQTRSMIDPTITLRRALSEHGDSVLYRGQSIHIITWAQKFEFEPDQLDTLVGKLSGGEKARVVIARLMLQEADVLLLDEPTNDLDIPTLETLEESLREFPGGLLLITHDRYMLNRICNQFIGLDGAGNSKVYASVEQWKRDVTSSSSSSETKANRKDVSSKAPPSAKKLTFTEQHELDRIEVTIHEAEQVVQTLEKKVSEMSSSSDIRKIMKELGEAQSRVDSLYSRWGELEKKRS